MSPWQCCRVPHLKPCPCHVHSPRSLSQSSQCTAIHTGLEEAYISYEVVTTTSLPQFSGGRFSVRRRFRDVVSLSNLLPKLLHGRCAGVTVARDGLQHRKNCLVIQATVGVCVCVQERSTYRRTTVLWPIVMGICICWYQFASQNALK